MRVRIWYITLVLVLLAGILAGCGTVATEADTSAVLTESGSSAVSAGAVQAESYEAALPVSSQLALGTFQLEGTETAISAQQAQILLPLWQIIQAGTLLSEAETGSVLAQIEGTMTPEQVSAIAAMQLTFEDIATWAQEQGVRLAARGDEAGGFALREGVTEEQMEAMRATAKANGMTPDGTGGMGAGQLAALAGPLVELLSQVAAE